MEKLFFSLLAIGAVGLAIYLVIQYKKAPPTTGAAGQTVAQSPVDPEKKFVADVKAEVTSLEKKL